MNSVSSPNGIVKTVESEKEVFNCRVTGNVPQGFGSNAIKEVTIFTEIFEDLVQGKIVKMSESTTCMKPVGPAPRTSKTVICQASKASVIPFEKIGCVYKQVTKAFGQKGNYCSNCGYYSNNSRRSSWYYSR